MVLEFVSRQTQKRRHERPGLPGNLSFVCLFYDGVVNQLRWPTALPARLPDW
jgi:hypothetical protein